MSDDSQNFSNFSMIELFRMEAEGQLAILNQSLVEIENVQDKAVLLEKLMRAAHSLKGAARMVGIEAVVMLAHAMEDCFVSAQKGKLVLVKGLVDLLLTMVDKIEMIASLQEGEMDAWYRFNKQELQVLVDRLEELSLSAAAASPVGAVSESLADTDQEKHNTIEVEVVPAARPVPGDPGSGERTININADKLTKMLGLASELLVENKSFNRISSAVLAIKRQHDELINLINEYRMFSSQLATVNGAPSESQGFMSDMQERVEKARRSSAEIYAFLENFERENFNLTKTLYNEVNGTRMRPFSTCVSGLPRMVRDLARELGKEVVFSLEGEDTLVDREVLERLKAPLNHLLRNSLDHGIERPDERALSGKALQATIKLRAFHFAGMLKVSVEDDGAGVNLDSLRMKVINKKLAEKSVVEQLSEHELLEFLFLPDFSTRDHVTEISGRGVGLDVVRDMVLSLGGSVFIENRPGNGVTFNLQLPLTLSVLSAIVVEISGEKYAFPVTQIEQILSLSHNDVQLMGGHHYFMLNGKSAALVLGSEILGLPDCEVHGDLSVVVVGDQEASYGIVVDNILEQRQLSVQAIDSRLGKLRDISSTALLEDGSVVLILDVDDLLRSAEHILSGERSPALLQSRKTEKRHSIKRILVVEDSLTVREIEREILQAYGYAVDTAVDGVDGWNAVRESEYDLVVTDIDMPRMDGIALLKSIKQDLHLKNIPVMIVSYKDRQEDRSRGLSAGADYYLAKGSFQDDTLIEAVLDLIGEPH